MSEAEPPVSSTAPQGSADESSSGTCKFDQGLEDVVESGSGSKPSHEQSTSAQPDSTVHAVAQLEAPQAVREPWYKRKLVRIVITRVLMRLGMIGLLIGLSFAFSYKSVVNKYADWIASFKPQAASLALFTAIASVFASIMPGSYAPVVLAGATYGIWLGWLVGYLTMNIGAALNLLFVRAGCKPLMARWCKNRLARLQLDVIEYMLREAPLRIVILLRLPVIASGILNYMFSLSDTLPMGPYVLGNLIGNIPGTLLFSLLGTMVRSIGKAILNGNPQPTALAVACVILVVVVAVIVVMALLVRRTLRKMKEDRHIGETVQPEAIVTVDVATPTAADATVDAPSETRDQSATLQFV